MGDPRKVLFAGDCHGNTQQVDYLVTQAIREDAESIFVLGDFGYWEHTDGGAFLDFCSQVATESGIPIRWLDGNHENHTWLRKRYFSEAVPRDEYGFVTIRENLLHAPRAHRWTWHGVSFMALGGAYSIDKEHRLMSEDRYRRRFAHCRHVLEVRPDSQEAAQAAWVLDGEQEVERLLERGEHLSWWPEEEVSDAERNEAMEGGKVHILLTHDKPLQSSPRWNRKDDDTSKINQQRIQDVVNVTQPDLLMHGHLHYRYSDRIRNHGLRLIQVEGLDCGPEGHPNKVANGDYDPRGSWLVLDVVGVSYKFGVGALSQ